MALSLPPRPPEAIIQPDPEENYDDVTYASRKRERNTLLELNSPWSEKDSEAPFTSRPEKFTDPDLISQLMKHHGMSSKVFSITMTDYDLKPNKVFDVPPPSSALMEYVDIFPSRRSEMERERNSTDLLQIPRTGRGIVEDNDPTHL
ncbi:coiled-coil domain-containing protein 80-like isoform X2 [Oncorhynchus masou masou]|uniref:coiled-coil domain-containing protein 80-like isoform X2 n=1 Tax=Oncorhynchus masou masou TaxID=90313 RepID=UPI003183F3D0